ncbi:acetylornithine transaminase [Brevibacterium sp. p3-SID960]|uniref:acetylornithine transaminase n=1 Tax=Brevibacterium sp. p3-SID960 TaxID=2916063 RepID=UPI0021A841DC|nr:acetylornithine transaminase [Brevibacterium sp. p3-SID960]MCT1690607.1 acetylornithine transaminase [Brevibacterium sp. p3-SID960]
MSWQDDYAQTMLPVFGAPKAKLVAADGCTVTDDAGRDYLDLLGGIAVNTLGHGHRAITEAVAGQLSTIDHVSNFFTTDPQLNLALKLLEIAGAPAGSQVFFANSGTEANEAAIKLARRVDAPDPGTPGRSRIIAVDGAFHGRTIGALSLTAKEAYRAPFAPLMPEATHVPFGDVDALRSAVDDTVAAVIIEPIQGERGVRLHPPGYLRAVREATRAAGALMILDEVQTGIGRTGHWFAFQHPEIGEDIMPDAITVAKGLAGGIPIGALITIGQNVSALLSAGQHGTTFGGNPVSAAAAVAVLDTIETDGLLAHVRATGDQLAEQLSAVPGVTAVRGAGLLRSFAITDPQHTDAGVLPVASALAAAAQEAGFIINPVTPDRIRLAPPLIITPTQLHSFIEALPALIADTVKAQS